MDWITSVGSSSKRESSRARWFRCFADFVVIAADGDCIPAALVEELVDTSIVASAIAGMAGTASASAAMPKTGSQPDAAMDTTAAASVAVTGSTPSVTWGTGGGELPSSANIRLSWLGTEADSFGRGPGEVRLS